MKKKTIDLLLIEDNPGDARLIQEMLAGLQQEKVTTEVCDRLDTGLTRLQAGGIDLVLLDLSLPDSHGLATLQRVLRHAAVPIVVLTGLDDQVLGITAVQQGAQDYLFKGEVSDRLLIRAVRYALERFENEQERQKLVMDLESFAHTVAHDLKAPLGPVLLASEMLENYSHELTLKEIKACSRTVAGGSRKMKVIIEELLLASVHRQDVTPEAMDMEAVVDQALRRLQPLIKKEKGKIRVPARWPAALGYGPWIEEVWVNYLSNAIKYGGKPPHVVLGATPLDNGAVCFWIRDNGAGILPQQQQNLFIPFTRLDQAKIQGHGLGLSIVHRIVEKLGGEVGVDSTPGEGSTFMFNLPAAPK